MDELLARALDGVDPDAPDAFWQVFWNLFTLLPWAALFWWSVVFVVVGAGLGWRRGRLAEGLLWAALLGPFGWLVILRRPVRRPPRLPRGTPPR
mgnify:CR=1 FL=1